MKTRPSRKFLFATFVCAGVIALCWSHDHALAVPTSAQLAEAFPARANVGLDAAPRITLFSLYSRGMQTEFDDVGPHPFHSYKVLGQTELKGDDKRRLLAHFYDAIAQEKKFRAACFAPHHGLRVEQNGKTVDVVICFTCGQFETYGLGPKTNSVIAKDGRAYFDSVLRRVNIEIQP